MEGMWPLFSGTPFRNNSGCPRASGEGVHNGHPWRAQDHLLRALQGMPVTLIIRTLKMIIIIMII